MSKTAQLQALMRKNFILMKRNKLARFCEFLFPIGTMILLAVSRLLINVETYGDMMISNDGKTADDQTYSGYNSLSASQTAKLAEFFDKNGTAYVPLDSSGSGSQALKVKDKWNGLTVKEPL